MVFNILLFWCLCTSTLLHAMGRDLRRVFIEPTTSTITDAATLTPQSVRSILKNSEFDFNEDQPKKKVSFHEEVTEQRMYHMTEYVPNQWQAQRAQPSSWFQTLCAWCCIPMEYEAVDWIEVHYQKCNVTQIPLDGTPKPLSRTGYLDAKLLQALLESTMTNAQTSKIAPQQAPQSEPAVSTQESSDSGLVLHDGIPARIRRGSLELYGITEAIENSDSSEHRDQAR